MTKAPTELLPLVRANIDAFVGETPQSNDITMMCLEYKKERSFEIRLCGDFKNGSDGVEGYMKKQKLLIVMAVLVLLLSAGYIALGRAVRLNEISEDVFETGTITKTNQKLYDLFLDKIFCGNFGGCTAVAATLENGETIVGRNYDFYISNKPGFIVRTKEKDKYETAGIVYYNEYIPDADVIRNKGLNILMYKMLPLFSLDVINDQGLYVEVNMRYGERDEAGSSVFPLTGTNPDSAQRACIAGLNTRLCQNCATVKEAIEYVNGLDLYGPDSEDMDWNFCYLMADATGDYGVLEVADNKVSFLDKQQIQTNFYVTKEFFDKQNLKSGVGRYAVLEKNIDNVSSEEDMSELMKSVSYAQSYMPEICSYDYRSEYVGENPGWTYDYIVDEKNQEEVIKYIKEQSDIFTGSSRQELKDMGTFWESTFMNVVNCNKKTMKISFYEDDSNCVEIKLGNSG